MNSCIHTGLRWLTRSGIQDFSGGVARYYRTDERRYAKLSTATTGYFISGLLRCAAFGTEKEEETERAPVPAEPSEAALRAGKFLLDKSYDPSCEMFFHEVDGDGSGKNYVYFLDAAAVIRAFIDLWKATRDKTYLDCAEKCAVGLKRNLLRMDGSFFPAFDLSRNMPYEADDPWWETAGVYHLKGGLIFRELAHITGLFEFDAMADDLKKWCLKRYESFVEPHPDAEHVMSHMHGYCYFLEGLLPEAGMDPDSSRALQFGILEVENFSQEIGHEFQRCDVLAQLLRLRLYADRLGIMELDYQQGEAEVAAIEEFQFQSTDPKIDGGFAFARKGGELVKNIDLSSTIFCIQALQMWEQAVHGGFRQTWEVLV